MYVMYYASMLWCWQLIRILVRTNHPCLRVGHHIGYQQWPLGPPRDRLRTRRRGQLFDASLSYLELLPW
jgi:hypothetical protein